MAAIDSAKAWFGRVAPNPGATVRLFCFPYAGGNATFFRRWGAALPFAEVYAAQLPGHGSRLAEPPFKDLAELVEAAAEALGPHLDKPFAFFGHSMGAMISFELARLLRGGRGVEPLHLFVSGRRAPQLPSTSPPTHDLPEPEFVEELRRLDGTPREVLEHPELMELMIPILRADFSVCQTYRYEDGPPLGCPITAFGGTEDEDANREHLQPWARQTTSDFTLRMFPGGHFFIHAALPQMLETIGRQLQPAGRA